MAHLVMPRFSVQPGPTAPRGVAMCSACQRHAARLAPAAAHLQQFRYATDFRHVDAIGQVVIEFYMCEQCGTRMQRDRTGLGRRQRWRTV